MEPLVVYIIGDVRSGSTLLDYLLSCHPKAYSLGELKNFKDYYYKTGNEDFHKWQCGCGVSVAECQFWKDIYEKASLPDDFRTKVAFQEPKWAFLVPPLFRWIINKAVAGMELSKRGEQMAENCWSIYAAASSLAGKSLIIDSSKIAYGAFYLNKHRKGNIRFILLERDICELAYSKLSRANRLKTHKVKSIYHYIIGSVKTMGRNRILARRIQSEVRNDNTVMTVNYLDLTTNPQRVIHDICRFLELESYSPPEMTNCKEDLGHTIGGSPTRYEKKKIQPDRRWLSYYRKRPFTRIFGSILVKYFTLEN